MNELGIRAEPGGLLSAGNSSRVGGKPMMTLIFKEVRLLRTAWIIALALAVLPVWFWGARLNNGTPVFLFWFGAGAILLGLAPFGREINSRTLNFLLSQPQSRRRVFFVKALTAAVAMSSVWVALGISYQFRFAGVAAAPSGLSLAALVAALAWSGGLWSALLFRQIIPALVVTICAPLTLTLLVMVLWEGFGALTGARPAETNPAVTMMWVLLGYSVAGFWWALWQFLQAQDLQWTGGVVYFPSLPSQRAGAYARRRPTESLILKELQLQQLNILFSLGLAGLYLVVVLVFPIVGTRFQMKLLTEGLVISVLGWSLIPIVIGAVAVAEERKLGVMDSFWQIPIGRFRRFATKLGVVLFLAFLLGAVIPWILESIAYTKHLPTLLFGDHPGYDNIPGRFLATTEALCFLALVSFYASTLSRNVLQSVGLFAVLAVGVFGLLAGPGRFVDRLGLYGLESLFEMIAWPTIIVTLLYLSYRNYARPQIGRATIGSNVIVWVAALLFIPAAVVGIGFRPWEWFMSLEPAHGPARLGLASRAELHSGISGFFALLPDGRLWAAREISVQKAVHPPSRRVSDEFSTWSAVPRRGVFLGGSNWVEVVQEQRGLYGLRADGSLWRIFATNLAGQVQLYFDEDLSVTGRPLRLEFQMERLGTNSDWRMLSGNLIDCLALRRDGSLWGWGPFSAILGEGAETTTNAPVRIGNDSDWVAVSVSGGQATAIKRDGTVWSWGYLPDPPQASAKPDRAKWHAHSAPVRWHSAGTNWVVLDGFRRDWNARLALHERGGMWFFGGYFGQPKLILIGPDTEWQRVENGRAFPEFKRRNERMAIPLGHGIKYYRSQYSDWLTPDDWWPYGLAADGTLSHWKSGDPWLMPSRRPVWSINILDDK